MEEEGRERGRESRIQHTDSDSSRETAALSKLSAPCGVNESALPANVYVHVRACVGVLLNKRVCSRRGPECTPCSHCSHPMLRQQNNGQQRGFHSESVETPYKKYLDLIHNRLSQGTRQLYTSVFHLKAG